MLHFLRTFAYPLFRSCRLVFDAPNTTPEHAESGPTGPEQPTLEQLKEATDTMWQQAIEIIDQRLEDANLTADLRTRLTDMKTRLTDVKSATYDQIDRLRASAQPIAQDFLALLEEVPGMENAVTALDTALREGGLDTARTSEQMAEARTKLVTDYVATLNHLPAISDFDAQGPQAVTAYYTALQSRIGSVNDAFIQLTHGLTRGVASRRLVENMSLLDNTLKEQIRNATIQALSPIKNELENVQILQNDSGLPALAQAYARMSASLGSLDAAPLSATQLAEQQVAVTQQITNETGIRPLDLSDADANQNPLLSILMTIAKAFGTQIYVDSENRIVGWGGGGKPGTARGNMSEAQKNDEFMLVASNYVDQHGWINDFNRLGIADVNLRASVSSVLLNSRCFPIDSSRGIDVTRQNIENIQERRNTFITKIAEVNSPSSTQNILDALSYLNEHPLEIVKGDTAPEKGKQLHVSDFSKYVENYRSFYER